QVADGAGTVVRTVDVVSHRGHGPQQGPGRDGTQDEVANGIHGTPPSGQGPRWMRGTGTGGRGTSASTVRGKNGFGGCEGPRARHPPDLGPRAGVFGSRSREPRR